MVSLDIASDAGRSSGIVSHWLNNALMLRPHDEGSRLRLQEICWPTYCSANHGRDSCTDDPLSAGASVRHADQKRATAESSGAWAANSIAKTGLR